MSVVQTEVSPLNCHWITWEHGLPVCTHPHGPRRHVDEAECLVCAHWSDAAPPARRAHRESGAPQARRSSQPPADPLNRETCPRCGTHDIVLKQQDALVQSFSCSICHQHWLATRPWPMPRDSRSHRGAD